MWAPEAKNCQSSDSPCGGSNYNSRNFEEGGFPVTMLEILSPEVLEPLESPNFILPNAFIVAIGAI